MVARQKSIHSRDVSTQQHLWLNTMREKYMCSFICKEEILCSTLEQNRARSFTRSLLSLHLLQKYIKSLRIINISIFVSFRTTETYNSFDEKPGKAGELGQIWWSKILLYALLWCHIDTKISDCWCGIFFQHCINVLTVPTYPKGDTNTVHAKSSIWIVNTNQVFTFFCLFWICFLFVSSFFFRCGISLSL